MQLNATFPTSKFNFDSIKLFSENATSSVDRAFIKDGSNEVWVSYNEEVPHSISVAAIFGEDTICKADPYVRISKMQRKSNVFWFPIDRAAIRDVEFGLVWIGPDEELKDPYLLKGRAIAFRSKSYFDDIPFVIGCSAFAAKKTSPFVAFDEQDEIKNKVEVFLNAARSIFIDIISPISPKTCSQKCSGIMSLFRNLQQEDWISFNERASHSSDFIKKSVAQNIPIGWPAKSILTIGEEISGVFGANGIDNLELFLRACPVGDPRHGILESLKTTPKSASNDILELARKCEFVGSGDSPIVIQRFIRPECSFVLRSKQVIFGPDNDGVTAGKKPNLIIQLNNNVLNDIFDFKNVLCQLGLKDNNVEIEGIVPARGPNGIIDGTAEAEFVQVRVAPDLNGQQAVKPPGSVDGFVFDSENPIRLSEYKSILEVCGTDLDELESAAGLEKPVIVFHESGNILSHASAWCRQNGWSYIGLSKKELGDRIGENKFVCEPRSCSVMFTDNPETFVSVNISDFYSAYYEGILYSLSGICEPIGKPHTRDKVRSILKNRSKLCWAFHYFSTGFQLSDEIAFLAGLFSGWLINAALVISLGESRHACAQIKDDSGSAVKFLDSIIRKDFKLHSNEWSEIAHRAHKEDLVSNPTASILNFHALEMIFNRFLWSSNFGGYKWGNIVKICREAYEAWVAGDTVTLINKINELTNIVHNGGWAYNKFSTKDWFDWFLKPIKHFEHLEFLIDAATSALHLLKEKEAGNLNFNREDLVGFSIFGDTNDVENAIVSIESKEIINSYESNEYEDDDDDADHCEDIEFEEEEGPPPDSEQEDECHYDHADEDATDSVQKVQKNDSMGIMIWKTKSGKPIKEVLTTSSIKEKNKTGE